MLAKNKRTTRRALKKGLVLSRKDGEDLQITLPDGRLVIITAVNARWGRTKLHVHAPTDCPIVRGELVEEPEGAAMAPESTATQAA